MASKTLSAKAWHDFKSSVDLLQNDSTYSDRQRAAIQNAALDLFAGLNGDAFAGKTVTVKSDVFQSATAPSMSVSVAFT